MGRGMVPLCLAGVLAFCAALAAARADGGSLVLESDSGEVRMIGRDAGGNELLPEFPLDHFQPEPLEEHPESQAVMSEKASPLFTARLAEHDWNQAFAGEIRAITVAVWVRPQEDYDGEPFWILHRHGGSEGQGTISVRMLEGGQFYFGAHAGPEFAEITGGSASHRVGPLPPGEWTHLALTFSEGIFEFFLNGHHVNSVRFKGDFLPSMAEIGIQRFRLMALTLPPGMLARDFVFLNGKALPPESIESLAKDGVGVLRE